MIYIYIYIYIYLYIYIGYDIMIRVDIRVWIRGYESIVLKYEGTRVLGSE